ncbi:hypothetical protein [Polycladomyces zharkentensis]|uniref:hypothetical protein n=1 Tax=Polycladomyces zharkentensis TaxID=2807616 RepID=UPI003AF326A7
MRFPHSGRIMYVRTYSFKEDQVRNQVLFRIPEEKGSIFVTDPFLQIYHEHGLTGLIFKEVWSSESAT